MLQNDASKRFSDFLDELDRVGVDPKHFAAFVRNVTGSATAGGGVDNIPGFEYAQRVTAAAGRALTAQAEELNTAWGEIRQGRFGIGMAMQSWSRVVENYFGVITEAWRGPSQLARPAWLVIPYSKGKKPKLSYSIPVERVLDKHATIEHTTFEAFGPANPVKNIYAEPPKAAGSRVEFRLDGATIDKLNPDTDYMGFIFETGKGASTPLVVIVLHVTA